MTSINAKIINAVTDCNLNYLKSLLKSDEVEDLGDILDYRNKKSSLLHIAARGIDRGGLKIAEYLLDLGINVNALNNDLETPLMTAIKHYKHVNTILCMCELLLDRGAKINATDRNGDTALHYSINKNKPDKELVLLLLKNEADPLIQNNNDYFPFTIALEWKHKETQKLLLDYMPVFYMNFCDNESLLQCAIRNYSPFIENMLEKGADPNEGGNGYSTFDYCLRYQRLDILELIIDQYIDRKQHHQSMLSRVFSVWNLIARYELKEFLKVIGGKNVKKIVTSLMHYNDFYIFVGRIHILDQKIYDSDKILYDLTQTLIQNGFRPTFADFMSCFQYRGFSNEINLMIENDDTMDCGDLGNAATLFKDVVGHQMLLMLHIGKSPRRKDILSNVKKLLVEHPVSGPDLIKAVERILTFTFDLDVTKTIIGKISMNIDNVGHLEKNVSSLVDLSRNAAREYICDYYNIKSFKKFYDVLKKSNLNMHILELLKFRTVLYEVKIKDSKITKI